MEERNRKKRELKAPLGSEAEMEREKLEPVIAEAEEEEGSAIVETISL